MRSVGIFACTLYGSAAVLAQVPDACTQAIPRAEASYVELRYEEVPSELAPCLNRVDLSQSDAISAYRLLTLSHIKEGELEEAKLALLELLNRVPGYEADPVRDLPAYVALVSLVRQQLQLAIGEVSQEPARQEAPRSWYRSRKNWLIAGGVLLGITTGLVLSGGAGGGASPLPLPPATP